jgi:MFS family permease
MLVVGQFTGALDRVVGSKATLVVGCGLAAASFAVLTTTPSERWQIYLASVLLGMGIGLAFAALANLIVQNVRQDQTGVATGMNTVMRTLGGAIGGQIAGAVLAGDIGSGGLPTGGAYALAFAFCGAAVVVGVAATLLIPGRPSPQPRSLAPDVATDVG